MGERESVMSREELISWLEEATWQLKTGTLMVDGENVAVPELVKTRLKAKEGKKGRSLKLQLEWEETTRKSDKKSGKVAEPEDSGPGAKVRDYDAHVLVCTGGDCTKKGAKNTKKALKSELRAEGLNRDVRVDNTGCLGLCKHGPNVVVYPEETWYLGLKDKSVPEVVEEHLKGGEPVERLAAERRVRKASRKVKR